MKRAPLWLWIFASVAALNALGHGFVAWANGLPSWLPGLAAAAAVFCIGLVAFLDQEMRKSS